MNKHTYKATFSDGEVLTRTSHREYAAAWGLVQNGQLLGGGFSKTRELAQKAAAAELSRACWVEGLIKNLNSNRLNRRLCAQDAIQRMGGLAAAKEKAQTMRASLTTEVVGVTLA